mmetsp:Transcript_20419/g.57460  ORF Transcript_20419/g.57460 Transcript_20419/m.57460 type:complete len:270 (-) Transcript_20419:407-1216(-)
MGVARDDDLIRLEVRVAALLLKEALEFAARGLVGEDKALGRHHACARLRIAERHFIDHEVRLPVTQGARGLPGHHADLAICPVLTEPVVGTLVESHLSVQRPRHVQELKRCRGQMGQGHPHVSSLAIGHGLIHIVNLPNNLEGTPVVAAAGHHNFVAWVREVLRAAHAGSPHKAQFGQPLRLGRGLADARAVLAHSIQGPSHEDIAREAHGPLHRALHTLQAPVWSVSRGPTWPILFDLLCGHGSEAVLGIGPEQSQGGHRISRTDPLK